MKIAVCSVVLFLAACSSQVSLGGEDEHVGSTMPDGSVVDATSTDAIHTADALPDGPHYDPCAGKACATPCTVCDPHDIACVEPPGAKQCNPHQQCVTALVCP